MTVSFSGLVSVGDAKTNTVRIGKGEPLAVICGPCVIESAEHLLGEAERICSIARECQMPLIFKSSYDKANRLSGQSYRGIGMKDGLEILAEVRRRFLVPVVTDVHSAEEATLAGSVVDLIQIPAFLCRQTDILIAAGKTGKPVMIKKGQFVPPEDMVYSATKVASVGNSQVVLCERGSCFGYRELVVDFRGVAKMGGLGVPVIFDATHSVQIMGGAQGVSSGQRQFVPTLARAAVAAGVDGVFIESHSQPDAAPSDGPNMVPLAELGNLLADLKILHELKLKTR